MSDIYDWDRHDRWPPDTCLALLAKLEQAERELEGYRRALVAHHNLANVSDAVIERYDWQECPVCKEARGA